MVLFPITIPTLVLLNVIYPKMTWRTRESGCLTTLNNTAVFVLVKMGLKDPNNIDQERAKIGIQTDRPIDGEV